MKIKKNYFLFIILIIGILTTSIGCGKSDNSSIKTNKNVENKITEASSNGNNNVSSQINNESKATDNNTTNNSVSKSDTNSSNESVVTNSSNKQSNTASTSKNSAAKKSSSTVKSDLQQSQQPLQEISTSAQKAPASTPKVPEPVQKASESTSKTPESKPSPTVQTFTGYITSEDDFAAELKEDTASMIYMRLMALSGLGITFKENGQWVFYYFDGDISTDNKGSDGKWNFNGTGSQLNAWKIVESQVKENNGANKMKPVPVTVTGILDENTKTNPGPDADGKYFKVITVKSITKN